MRRHFVAIADCSFWHHPWTRWDEAGLQQKTEKEKEWREEEGLCAMREKGAMERERGGQADECKGWEVRQGRENMRGSKSTRHFLFAQEINSSEIKRS